MTRTDAQGASGRRVWFVRTRTWADDTNHAQPGDPVEAKLSEGARGSAGAAL
jgi:hypothetical protein